MKHKLTSGLMKSFKEFLINEEKSQATIEKYIRDVSVFQNWVSGNTIDKNRVLEYKEHLKEKYKTSSVNSMLSSINSFFDFVDWKDCKVKTIKIQKQLFYEEDRELSKCEYKGWRFELCFAVRQQCVLLLL